MLQDTDIHRLAQQVQAAQDQVQQIAPLTATPGGLDLASAYAVAERVHRTRLQAGAVAVGRKIGFTNAVLWDAYGVRQPMWGWMYAGTQVPVQAQRARCSLARFAEPKIEPEIVLHFHSAPPAGAGADGDLAAVLACIDWVAHGFEIVQSHYPGWKFQAADTIADGGLHGALLVGAPLAVADLGQDGVAALQSLALVLTCDDVERDRGRGVNVLGNPLAAIVHLMAVLAADPQAAPIQAGETITTGTLTAAHAVSAGQRWSTTVQGIALPGLTVDFVA